MTPLEHVGLAAAANGIEFEQFVEIQSTNNVVGWLQPAAVVVKVGRWTHSAPGLILEHDVVRQIAAVGAPVAAPLGIPYTEPTTSMVTTLWSKLDAFDDAETADPTTLAACLTSVHSALIEVTIDLPDFRDGIDLAARSLFDDHAVREMAEAERRLLRSCHWQLRSEIDDLSFECVPIHGEPHTGNVMVGGTHAYLIDFETVCRGPIEWDLASLPPGVAAEFDGIDDHLLSRLRILNSIRVATWCWVSRSSLIRTHGVHHLDVVRAFAEQSP